MTASTYNLTSVTDTLRHQTRLVHDIVRRSLDGVTQAESLIQPPAGNCLNWIVGHLIAVYNGALPLMAQEPVLEATILQRYARGSEPLLHDAEALDISDLMTAWDECCTRVDTGLASLSNERLAAPAPRSPTRNAEETIGSLLSTMCWHQAYHTGQTGLLRRMIGKPGPIG